MDSLNYPHNSQHFGVVNFDWRNKQVRETPRRCNILSWLSNMSGGLARGKKGQRVGGMKLNGV